MKRENMGKSQAEILAKRIQHEISHFIALPEKEEWVGGQSWTVKIFVRSSGLFLGSIASPEEWDLRKEQDLKPPFSKN